MLRACGAGSAAKLSPQRLAAGMIFFTIPLSGVIIRKFHEKSNSFPYPCIA
jgi:hypothetical protein